MNEVQLVSATPRAELLILYIARVSSNQDNSKIGLINYLIKNKHWSPFEMVDMCVEINTSRAISQQILRHRSFSFQEFSQRYARVTDYVVYEARRQAEKNRQSSVDGLTDEIKEYWIDLQNEVASFAFDKYNEALSHGIAKECARFLLPLNTATKIYMKGSMRSWIHYLELRCDEHTQLEHREIANEIKKIFVVNFPITSAALGWRNETLVLLDDCKTRDDVIPIYRKLLLTKSPTWAGWQPINKAIIKRWSESGLKYIKKEAWSS